MVSCLILLVSLALKANFVYCPFFDIEVFCAIISKERTLTPRNLLGLYFANFAWMDCSFDSNESLMTVVRCSKSSECINWLLLAAPEWQWSNFSAGLQIIRIPPASLLKTTECDHLGVRPNCHERTMQIMSCVPDMTRYAIHSVGVQSVPLLKVSEECPFAMVHT